MTLDKEKEPRSSCCQVRVSHCRVQNKNPQLFRAPAVAIPSITANHLLIKAEAWI